MAIRPIHETLARLQGGLFLDTCSEKLAEAVTIGPSGCLVRNDGGKTNSAGAATAARLVSFGLVTGHGGLLALTEYGKRQAGPVWPVKEQ